MKRITSFLAVTATAALMATACQSPGEGGESAEDFYSGQTLRMLVPFPTAGGADNAGRLYAQHFDNHVEGLSSVQVENVPGADAVTGSNQYANVTEKDGMTVFLSSGSVHIQQIIGEPAVEYDFSEFTPLLAATESGVVYAGADSGVEEPADLLNPPEQLTMGLNTPTSLSLVSLVALELLEADFEAVAGYDGAAATRTALEQGETSLDYQTTTAHHSNMVQLVETGAAVPLFSHGVPNEDGEIERDPGLPEIPTFEEVYEELHGEEPAGTEYEAYRSLVLAGYSIGKTMWVHNEAPAAAQQALEDGAEAMAEDEEFLSGAEDVFGATTIATGDEVRNWVDQGMDISEDAQQWLVDYLVNEHGVDRLAG